MASQYVLFGLVVQSSRAIPGLIPRPTSSLVDIAIEFGASPSDDKSASGETLWYQTTAVDSQSEKPALQIWDLPDRNLLRLDYFDGTKFWLDRPGRRLWVLWPEDSSASVAASYLLGPVLGIVLRLRGATCLHGSAVEIDGNAALFVGPPGAGKSTTAAALALRGHPVLSDDIVALKEKADSFTVLPAYPHLCLWPDAVGMLFGSPEALPRLAEDSEKRRFALAGSKARFQSEAAIISRVYLLGERQMGSLSLLRQVPSQEALMCLISNVFAANIPSERLRAQEFVSLGKLLSQVRVQRIHAHTEGLTGLCEAIERDVSRESTLSP